MNIINKIIVKDTEGSLKLNISLVVLIALITISSTGIYSLNQYLLMAVCVTILLFSSYKDCKYLLFFLMPLACALQAFTISIGAFMLFIKAPQKRFGYLMPFAILVLFEAAHVLNTSVTIVDFAYYASYLFVFFYLMSDNDSLTSPRFCVKMSCYGFMLALFAVVYGMINTFGVAGAFSGLFRDGTIIGASSEEGAVGVSLNANSVAYYSLALLSMLLCQPSRLKMSRIVIATGVIIAVMAGVISFSRTWLLLVAIFVLALFGLTSRKISLIITLLAAVIIVPTFSIFADVTSGYTERFNSDDMETAGNRKGITMRLFDYMNENPDAYFWGSGVLTYGDNTKQTVSPHNATQQVFVCTGLLGLLLFAYPIYKNCTRYYSKKRGWLPYLPFFICLLDIQTIQFLSPHFLMLPLLICLYCIKPEILEHE